MNRADNKGNTPAFLQELLVNEIRHIFSESKYNSEDGTPKKINIFKQDLPIPENDTGDEYSPVPYIIVRISQGQTEVGDKAKVDVQLVFCIFDESSERQGYTEILNMIDKTSFRFMTKPYIGNFRLNGTLEWALQDDVESYPYYFGGIEMSFESALALSLEDDYA